MFFHVNEAQQLAVYYVIPIALWLTLLAILFRVWWSRKLEDSLAYLVFLRERKVLFVSLIALMAVIHLSNESIKIATGIGWIGGPVALEAGLTASVAGALTLFFFAWSLLRGAAKRVARPIVLDIPPHLAYSLGVLDRAEQERTEPGIH